MASKPVECIGCTLYTKGNGFAQAVGPIDAPLCFVGDALVRAEAVKSQPFVGDAGVYLNRAFARLGIQRNQVRLGNVVSCQPPNDWLTGAPWEHSSIHHCNVHRSKLLAEKHTVYVALGVTAARTLCKEILGIEYKGNLNDWHGYVLGTGPYVVCTYHPAYLLRGNHKLFGVFLHDIKRAMEVAAFGYVPEPIDAVFDPDPSWFTRYVETVCTGPDDQWLSVDIETPINEADEADYALGIFPSITRISFSNNPKQGVSLPWDERYLFGIKRLLTLDCPKVFWNERFDVPILSHHGFEPRGVHLDGMWAWHMLQSDVPKGLGFVSPFYNKIEPWKHTSQDDPGPYSAVDAAAALANMMGIAKGLQQSGQWESFMKYVVNLDRKVLHPAENQGILISRAGLDQLNQELMSAEAIKIAEIRALVPDEVVPWDGGWKREPDPKRWPGAVRRTVKETVLCCTECSAVEVGPAHKCKRG